VLDNKGQASNEVKVWHCQWGWGCAASWYYSRPGIICNMWPL